MSPFQFRLDPNRCVGCETCVLACRMANLPAQSLPWRRVHTFNPRRLPGLPVVHLSLACHHCDAPACLRHCPAGAYRRDPATGAVILAAERCMGCRYCTWACPYEAPRFDPDRGTAAKCSFCADRQHQGLQPACVAACPLGALELEARDSEPRGDLPLGFPPSALGPAIRVLPGRRPAPVPTAAPEPGLLARCRKAILAVPEPRITLRGEWPLVLFTATLATLVAVMATVAARAGRILPRPFPYPWPFLWAGTVAVSASALHLGRPDRGWRAVRNLRHSWLSREVVLVMAFLGLAGASLLGYPQGRALAWVAAGVGWAALFAVDRVYQVATRSGPGNFHSAHALFNGLYLTGLLAGSWPLAAAAGALKVALYLNRKRHFRRRGRRVRPALSLVRLLLGFGLPVLAFGTGWAVLGALLGDLLDRCEYYAELQIPSPAAQLAQDLETFG